MPYPIAGTSSEASESRKHDASRPRPPAARVRAELAVGEIQPPLARVFFPDRGKKAPGVGARDLVEPVLCAAPLACIGADAVAQPGVAGVFVRAVVLALRQAAGGALVFACSHLHEVTEVRQGRRFVLLSFLFSEGESRPVRARSTERAPLPPPAPR